MLPHERIQRVFGRWVKWISVPVGHNIFDPNFTITVPTVICYIGMYVFFFSALYTVYAFDLELGIQSIVMFGVVGQVHTIYIPCACVVCFKFNYICLISLGYGEELLPNNKAKGIDSATGSAGRVVQAK